MLLRAQTGNNEIDHDVTFELRVLIHNLNITKKQVRKYLQKIQENLRTQQNPPKNSDEYVIGVQCVIPLPLC